MITATARETPTTGRAAPSLGADVARSLAPWIAVAIGLLWLSNAWVAIGLYHVQIVAWRRLAPDAGLRDKGSARAGVSRWALAASAPSALVGPAVYLLVPVVAAMPLTEWLASIGLGQQFWLMALYFAQVHPPLEEAHWAGLRERRAWSHVVFAGYHGAVLLMLTGPLLALGVVAGLAAVSWGWAWLTRRTGSRWPSLASHAVADAAVIVAAAALL